MSTLGRQLLDTTGRPVEVSADGAPEMKGRGVTIDWSTFAAAGADAVLADDTPVKTGDKFARYGQVICMIGVAEVDTVEFTGGPTSGSAVLTMPATATEDAASVTVAYNATAAVVQAAFEALPRVGPGGVVVTRAGAGSAGSPYVYTFTWARRFGNLAAITQTNTFAGGTSPTVTVGESTAGTTGAGKYGPYDPAATDGRQTLARGECAFFNRTVLEKELASDHQAAAEGGKMWKQRLLITTGSASLAAGPTVANFETAFPRVSYAS